MIYLVTGEYWGTNTTRIPSIYWAAIKPTMDICQLSREDQGMVASQDGLAFGYPVIAGKRHGLGGVIAFSYSGGDMMAGGMYRAWPGKCCWVFKGWIDFVDSQGLLGSTQSGKVWGTCRLFAHGQLGSFQKARGCQLTYRVQGWGRTAEVFTGSLCLSECTLAPKTSWPGSPTQ
jgi:hypothetical protein